MRTSLGLMYLVGLSTASVCRRIRLPRIIGLLITGIVLGPYALDLLDPSIIGISSELRQLALVIILIKAGLSLRAAAQLKLGTTAGTAAAGLVLPLITVMSCCSQPAGMIPASVCTAS